jgi:Fe-S cluster biosynthesis and repair protein YggX
MNINIITWNFIRMVNTIFCIKLKQFCDSMPQAPFPGELGQQIYKHVSQKAWNMWIAHQTMLINEYRLNLIDKQAREFLREEMQKYFFGEGSNKPAGFKEI